MYRRLSLVLAAVVALAAIPAAADVTVYRALNGKPKNDTRSPDGKCWNGAQTSPSQFRIDPDGLSTFEDPPGVGTTHPYRVRFVVTGVGACTNDSRDDNGPVTGMAGYRGTCSPQHGGQGHWSLDNTARSESEKKQEFSDHAGAGGDTQGNPGYNGTRPYCADLDG